MKKQKANRMALGDVIKVSDWLRNRREVIERDLPTMAELAETISKEVKVPVRGAKVKQLLDAIGVPAYKPRIKPHQGNFGSQLALLRDKIARLEATVEAHNDTIAELRHMIMTSHVGVPLQ